MSEPAPPPFGYGVYDPPGSQRGRPAVILWFRTYAALIALVSSGAAVVAQWEHMERGGDPPWTLCLVCMGIAVPHALGAAVPHKPWGWTYAFVLLALGFFSCMLPFALGLLLYWKEPTTKAAFRRFL